MSRVTFRVAEPVDDEGIRRLLRESSTGGRMTLSLRREPDYFAAGQIAGLETTIVAVGAGRIVCVGSVAVRDRYVNGRVMSVGYLGQLRLAASHAGRIDVLRRGYSFFDSIRPALGASLYFTSIAADNCRALRLLGRGARGLPRYEAIGELVTLLFATTRFGASRSMVRQTESPAEPSPTAGSSSITELLATANVGCQLAPVWTADDLQRVRSLGLRDESWSIAGVGDRVDLAAALWDQRAFKQVVVSGYSPWLRRLRPLYNAFSTLRHRLPLPRVGEVVSQAFICPVAIRDGQPDRMSDVLYDLGSKAKADGIRALTWSTDARDPRLPHLRRRFRPRAYHTTLFKVTWPGDPSVPLDGRLMYPDAALL